MSGRARPSAVITGASGFVGGAVARAFADDGYEVRLIGRSAEVRWGETDAIARTVDGADIVINFAGKSVNCRYTDRNRREILDSRVLTTRALHDAVAAASRPPRLWLNASTATIYRHSTDRANTEAEGNIGEGFSVDVATSWEREFFAGSLPHTRRVSLRMAIVLGDGPAAQLLFRLAKLGLGGTQFDGWCPPHRRYRGIGERPTGQQTAPWYRTGGLQKFSWVHIDDVVSAIKFIRDHSELTGPINIAAPHPSDNRTLMRGLREVVGAPVGLPVMRWMLELGMFVLRTEPELILKSRWVLPGVLSDAGFTFKYPELRPALASIHRQEG